MEFIILIGIILVLCFILGVNFNYLLFGIAILGCVVFGLMMFGFAYCAIRLMFAKRKEASFVRFGGVNDSRMQVAYYLVEGEEYPCLFPKEFIMDNKLYSPDKIYNVMMDTKSKKVYDRYAIATCILGLLFSAGFCAFMAMLLL